MEKFTTLSGVAAPLPIINLDTDKIFPAVYLKTIKRTGLSQWLFQEIRFRPDGSENPDFVLNQAPYRNAKILIGADNFGCGSSREHAPWALLDFGIRCVIAPSFGEIFFSNCFRNGLLPVVLQPQDVLNLRRQLHESPGAQMTVDLEQQCVYGPDNREYRFEIDSARKLRLTKGLDDAALALEYLGAIERFEQRHLKEWPWAVAK